MFEEQNATEIEYNGKRISALYRYDKKGKYRLKFTFVSTNTQHEQSIILHLDGFKGKIFWNGKRLKKERRRFHHIAPFRFQDQKSNRQSHHPNQYHCSKTETYPNLILL